MAKKETEATKQAKVSGIVVTIRQPYAEGHPVNANEAKALNQTRTENIQNNCRKAINDLLEANGMTADNVSDEVHAKVQEIISAYDAEYEFAVRTAAASVVDPKEKEARKLVRENIKAQLKAQSIKISDVDAAAIDAKIDEVLADPKVGKLFWDTAEANMAQQARIADAKLGDLSL